MKARIGQSAGISPGVPFLFAHDMDIRKMLLVSAFTVATIPAFAQEKYGTMGPPESNANFANTSTSTLDKNGDGAIEKSELSASSQLYKRFETRDANGDGKLTKDEYWMP